MLPDILSVVLLTGLPKSRLNRDVFARLVTWVDACLNVLESLLMKPRHHSQRCFCGITVALPSRANYPSNIRMLASDCRLYVSDYFVGMTDCNYPVEPNLNAVRRSTRFLKCVDLSQCINRCRWTPACVLVERSVRQYRKQDLGVVQRECRQI